MKKKFYFMENKDIYRFVEITTFHEFISKLLEKKIVKFSIFKKLVKLIKICAELLECTLFEFRKVKFLSKNSILRKPQNFYEFFTQKFFDNFSREIKIVNSQKVQNQNIFTSFSPKKSTIFSKNQDFEQCVKLM